MSPTACIWEKEIVVSQHSRNSLTIYRKCNENSVGPTSNLKKNLKNSTISERSTVPGAYCNT
jgi:hypothetical protein